MVPEISGGGRRGDGDRISQCPKCAAQVACRDEQKLVLDCPSCAAIFLRPPEEPGAVVASSEADEIADPDDSPDDELLLTEEFVARYELQRMLGAGGAGRVYLARDKQSGESVAIKFMLALSDPQVARRFAREGKLLTAVNDPHVVHLLDMGELPTGIPYLVSEFIPGGTLRTRLREGGPVPVREALGFSLDLLRGLQALHAAGVTHRDIKPENILIDARGRARIADLGLARQEESGEAKLTATGAILGTPRYMSPEQAKGLPTTAAADVYAAGVVLHELLTGKTPFQGASYFELMRDHVEMRPQPLRSLIPTLSPALEAIVGSALEKQPQDRPTTAAMAAALSSCAREIDRQTRTRWLLVAGLVAVLGWLTVHIDFRGGRAGALLAKGVSLVEQGKPSEALVPLGQARRLLGDAGDPDETASVATYIGRAHLKLGQLEPARKSFELAQSLWETKYGAEGLQVSEAWADLGALELAAGRPAAAAEKLEHVLSIRSRLLKPTEPALADAQRSLGMALLQSGNPGRGEQLLRQALATWEARGGEGGLEMARCLNAIAWLESSQGKPTEALAHYKRALAIFTAKLPGHPDVANVLSNTASVYMKLGDQASALALYDQALGILDRAGLRKKPLAAQLLINIGDAHLAAHHADQAVPVLEEAVALLRGTLGGDHPAIAIGLFNLGRAYFSRKLEARAEACLVEALAIQEKVYPPHHPELLQSVSALAFMRVSQGKIAEAQAWTDRIVALDGAVLTPSHASFVGTLDELANVYVGRGLLQPALALNQKSAELSRLLFGAQDARTVSAETTLARMRERLAARKSGVPREGGAP